MGPRKPRQNAPKFGESSFVVYNQPPATDGSSGMVYDAQHVRRQAARSGWLARKRKPKRMQPQSRTSSGVEGQGASHEVHCAGQQDDRNQCTCVALTARVARTDAFPTASKYRGGSRQFLEVVLNEDYPLCSTIDSDSGLSELAPVPWKPVFGLLMDFWVHQVEPFSLKQINHGWSARKCSLHTQMFFDIRLAPEAVAFYSNLGLAAIQLPPSHFLAPRNAPRLSLVLQRKATQAMRKAVLDAKGVYSNSLSCGVSFLLSQAFMLGQGELAAKMYAPVLQRMVEVRGGLSEIAKEGERGAMFAEMLAWNDTICATASGSPRLFPDRETSTIASTDWTALAAPAEERTQRVIEEAEAGMKRKRKRN